MNLVRKSMAIYERIRLICPPSIFITVFYSTKNTFLNKGIYHITDVKLWVHIRLCSLIGVLCIVEQYRIERGDNCACKNHTKQQYYMASEACNCFSKTRRSPVVVK